MLKAFTEMYYTVKDEEFKIGTRKGEYRNALNAKEQNKK